MNRALSMIVLPPVFVILMSWCLQKSVHAQDPQSPIDQFLLDGIDIDSALQPLDAKEQCRRNLIRSYDSQRTGPNFTVRISFAIKLPMNDAVVVLTQSGVVMGRANTDARGFASFWGI